MELEILATIALASLTHGSLEYWTRIKCGNQAILLFTGDMPVIVAIKHLKASEHIECFDVRLGQTVWEFLKLCIVHHALMQSQDLHTKYFSHHGLAPLKQLHNNFKFETVVTVRFRWCLLCVCSMCLTKAACYWSEAEVDFGPMQANYKEADKKYAKAIRYAQPNVFDDYQPTESDRDQLAKAQLPNLLNRSDKTKCLPLAYALFNAILLTILPSIKPFYCAVVYSLMSLLQNPTKFCSTSTVLYSVIANMQQAMISETFLLRQY